MPRYPIECIRRSLAPLAVALSCATVIGDWSAPNQLTADAPTGASGARLTPFIWGVNGHPGKQSAYAGSGEGLRRQLRYVKRLGATHYRVDLYPDSTGRVDPAFDGIVETAGRLGVTILPALVAHPKADADTASNYLRGRAMGLGFAMRYQGRFSHIEAGNELQIGTLRVVIDSSVTPPRVGYFEGFSLDNYIDSMLVKTTAFLRGMTDGIHQGSPGTKVIINGAWRHFGFFEALRRDRVDFDVYGYHWYSEMGDFRAEVLPHLPKDKDIWITEANRRNTHESADAPAEQAEWISKFARQAVTIPRVKAFFVYELYEQPAFAADPPESKYGIIACSDAECSGPKKLKPAFGAYRAAIVDAR